MPQLSEEFLLLVFPVVLVAAVPLYVFFRERMNKGVRRATAGYSRRRVFKLTAVNLFLNLLLTSYFAALLLQMIPSIGTLTPDILSYIILLLFMVCVTFYGNGIYITSIVLEAYTAPELRRDRGFPTQFIATHLFHGPISHVLMHSGWLFAGLFLALIDVAKGAAIVSVSGFWLVLAGAVTGILYAIAQLYNGTAPYQLVSGLAALGVFLAAWGNQGGNLLSFPVASYFLSMLVVFDVALFSYVTFSELKYGRINWDKSGY